MKMKRYGKICDEGEYEWWVRRKKEGKSEVVITKESEDRVTEYSLNTVVNGRNSCPRMVKETARVLLNRLN